MHMQKKQRNVTNECCVTKLMKKWFFKFYSCQK